MTFATTLLCLSFLSPMTQRPQSPLKLPPRPENPGVVAPVQRPLSEVERFRRDLQELTGSIANVESRLVTIGQTYPAIEALTIEVARSARANEMALLMAVARRYGTAKVADELKFQLLTRPLAEATRPVVDAMAFLMDQDPAIDCKRALQDVIRGRIPSARRPATEVLAQRATAADLPFALQLSSEQTLDLQLRGVELLRAVPDPAARDRLVALLSKDPALAAVACESLIALRDEAVPHLQKLLAEPAIDRSYCYAAFALAQIGEAAGAPCLDQKTAEPLLQKLGDGESLTRTLAAVALADLAYQSAADCPIDFRDVQIAEVLLDVVDSKVFVPNLDLLRRPAEQRLVRLTGRVSAGGETMGWREWWKGQRDGFVGIRAKVEVTAANVADVVVALRQDRNHVRLLAEGLADLPALPGAQEILLTKEQMLELVAQLRQGGLGNTESLRSPSGLPLVRSLQLQVRGARVQVSMPASKHEQFDAMVATVQKVIDSELWQLYRNPNDEPDRAAYWRAERRWLDGNPDPIARGRRFTSRVFQQWATLSPQLRGRALEHLFARSDRRQLFTEAEGDRILAAVQAAPELGELELRLLELAAGVPGDRVWRECVDHAARAKGGGQPAVRAVFAVLGPDAVLEALRDLRSIVRRVAIDEVVLVRDLRAAARLVEMLADGDVDVQRAAAHACGQLQVAAASRPLIALIAALETPSIVRREALRALGRVGGDQAFAVLDRAMESPQQEDKEAAMRGLGELRDPRAAHRLAELAVVGHGKDLGQLARFHLQRLGGILAVPAVRHQLTIIQEPAVRAELVLLLGGYQDVQVIPDLLDLLRQPAHAANAAAALSGTTGVEVQGVEDRIGTMEQWWRKSKGTAQWQWLLDGLRATETPTVLRPEMFAPGAGLQAVPELSRLLAECKLPRLCVLTSAVLRTITNEDYGVVTLNTPAEVRGGIAARYRLLVDAQQTAAGR